jgi:hypothetical protein
MRIEKAGKVVGIRKCEADQEPQTSSPVALAGAPVREAVRCSKRRETDRIEQIGRRTQGKRAE